MCYAIDFDKNGMTFKKDEINFVNLKGNQVIISLNPESEDYKKIMFDTLKKLLDKWKYTK